MKLDIVRAWKDEAYRESLTEEQNALLPANPIGELALSDAELATVHGGSNGDDCNCDDGYGYSYGYGRRGGHSHGGGHRSGNRGFRRYHSRSFDFRGSFGLDCDY